MLRQWVTVVRWQNGQLLLRYDLQSSCNHCGEQASCGHRLFNKLITPQQPLITLDYPTPLQAGQKVELAIGESSLLGSACLVYLPPLIGLLAMAMLFQSLFSSDLAALCGAALGGFGGFLLARAGWHMLNQRYCWQPVIIAIAPMTHGQNVMQISESGQGCK